LAATGITALAAAAAVSAPIAIATTGTPTIKLTSTSKGKILTSGGYTLFMFTRDTANKDNCGKTCKGTWPPLYTSGKPQAGPGVNASLIGTIKLASGKRQATYNKHPLYRYKPDLQLGMKAETYYIGFFQFGGYWYGVNAAGKAVK
jgi:predicted lipoprotein with Yx(FWY)xxD motif